MFGSRKVTTVGTTVTKLVEDEYLPNSIKSGTLKSLIKGEPLVPYILEEVINGLAIKGKKVYKYAERGNYPYGLPSGQFLSNNMATQEVIDILTDLEGDAIKLVYNYISQPNYLHFGRVKLIRDYGYNTVTHEIEELATEETSLFLHNIKILLTDEMFDETSLDSLAKWGEDPAIGEYSHISNFGLFDMSVFIRRSDTFNQLIINNDIDHPSIRLAYGSYAHVELEEDDLDLWDPEFRSMFDRLNIQGMLGSSQYMDISLEGEFIDADYLQVCYKVNGETKYWTYELGTGTYPEIDELIENAPSVGGQFYPFQYYRYNKREEREGDTGYESTKKMHKYLGLDYQDIIDKIHENEDIADVEQAMLFMAVPMNSEEPLVHKYLYDFFYQLQNSQETATSTRALDILNSDAYDYSGVTTMNMPRHRITIADSRFVFTLSYDQINLKTLGGTIGSVGFCNKEYAEEHYYLPVEVPDDSDGATEPTKTVLEQFTITNHILRKQVAQGFYTEMTVSNPRFTYHIYGKHHDSGFKEEDALLIPIDQSLISSYNLKNREEIYARGLYFVFNSRITQKIKWYQDDFFMGFVSAIFMVVAAWMGGAPAILASLAAATTAIAVGTILIEIILTAILIQVAVKIFIKILGPKVAMMAALVAAFISMGMQALELMKNAPWANHLLTAANGLLKGATDYYNEALIGITSEFEELHQEMEEASELMKEIYDDLYSDPVLSPLFIVGETPTQYFNRTKYAGNVGVSAVRDVSTYVRRALTLPTISDTIGEYNYGRRSL